MIGWLAFAVLLPLSGCRCQDRVDYGWAFEEPEDATDTGRLDVPEPPDTRPDTPDTVHIPDSRDVPPVEDIAPEPDAWDPENVVSNIECRQALNDRTSLVIDDRGTAWLGYHSYSGRGCELSSLVVTHRRANSRWQRETLRRPHQGIFALSVIEPNRPISVFPDARDGQFKSAMRQGDGRWSTQAFDIGSHTVGNGDGFDATHDADTYFVTFAADRGQQVRLFSYDTSAANPTWKSRRGLRAQDPQAAMERGLRADTNDSVYLVHRNEDVGRFGLARYDKADDLWPQRVYLPERYAGANVHSFVITEDFELCLSGSFQQNLFVTCGTMFDLTAHEDRVFGGIDISERFPSSIVEGNNGTLYVAFNPTGNTALRVAKGTPGGSWSVRTIYDGPSYGISTAIDEDGKLALSFYTCEDGGRGTCSLKLVREQPW